MARRAILFGACIVLAGCLGGPGTGPAPTEPTDGTPMASEPSATDERLAVSYVLRAGNMPETVAHVHLDLAVYLAEHAEDVYACTDGAPLMDNEFDPSPTPLPTAAGRCERVDVERVDLARLNGTRTLGPFTASGTYSGGHSLVVHDVTVVLENGTTATSVYDTDFRAVTEQATPSGSMGVEIGVTDHRGSDDLRWRFAVTVDRSDPD